MTSNSTTDHSITNVYPYTPSHVLPVFFATLAGVSLILHTYQNFLYRFWRITFFTFWAGTVFTTGWILRCISTYQSKNLNLYIAQYVFIYAGPPIYAAVEYNVLGRLMHYIPMHAFLSPYRVVYFFIYLGAVVEGLTAAGASLAASASKSDRAQVMRTGGTLISISLVLQGAVELTFFAMVATLHVRCVRAKTLPSNVRKLCIMLYGTSLLILVRCIFRAVEAFATFDVTRCDGTCNAILRQEWYLYALEATPMIIYSYWLNLMHPGGLLPRQRNHYLDGDGVTERIGPGWTDRRSAWQTFMDPFDVMGQLSGQHAHEMFWLQPEKWQVADGDSFAQGTATNINEGALSRFAHPFGRRSST